MGTTTTRFRAAIGCAALLGAAGLVHAVASWVGQPYSLAIPTHITTRGQAVSGFIVLSLDHDASCTLSVSAAGAGSEVLTNGTATLTTSYKLTGPSLVNGDADWVSSDVFVTQVYGVQGAASPDSITLSVRAAAPPDRAPEAGGYSAALVLTASW